MMINEDYDLQEVFKLPLMSRLLFILSLAREGKEGLLVYEQESCACNLRRETDDEAKVSELLSHYEQLNFAYIAELEELFSREMSTEEVYTELLKQYDVYLERVNIPLDEIEALPLGEQRATAYMKWWSDSWRCSLIIRLTKIVEEPVDTE